ncbi:UNVERIFIED_CONTAM: hypothetical protein GTU68_011610 [Idotea baltica]|nr:hypothetical protein [Idotea baltica]
MGGSVKARPAFNIIKQAILEGKLTEGKHLLDATSGNTGIAYATFGAALGIPITLCLPENASQERKQILTALGVDLIYTSRFESTDGAQLKAKELVAQNPEKYYYADQYANDNNWKAHYNGTALEIWEKTNQQITHFVAGLGTTGTFMGTSKRLHELNENIECVALQPNNPMHGLEGWKHLETAIVPKIYNENAADSFLEVDTIESFDMVKSIAQKEGLLVSPSAAANLLGAIQIAEQIDEGVIVTTFADNAEKYSEVMKHIFG